MKDTDEVIVGLVLDEACSLTLGELSRACRVHAEWVIELVEQGIIEPYERPAGQWRFSGPCLSRALKVQRLQRDLGVNLAGAALALDLLDEVRELRERLALMDAGGR